MASFERERGRKKNVEIFKIVSGVTTHPCFVIFSILSGLMNNARKLQKHYVVTRTPGDINSLSAPPCFILPCFFFSLSLLCVRKKMTFLSAGLQVSEFLVVFCLSEI